MKSVNQGGVDGNVAAQECVASIGVATLAWGIKASFRQYLEHIDDVEVVVSDGAATSPSGFEFPASQTVAPDAMGFHGRVQISAYEGLLSVALQAPSIRYVDDGWTLESIEDDPDAGRRLADLTVASVRETAHRVDLTFDAALTGEGAIWLGAQYHAGQTVDPVIVHLTRDHWASISQPTRQGASS